MVDDSRRLDAAGIWYEVGRQTQAVAVVMRKHHLIAAQQLCACGRLPVHAVPGFGPRCEIAHRQWKRAHAAMSRVIAASGRAVGRAAVRGGGPR